MINFIKISKFMCWNKYWFECVKIYGEINRKGKCISVKIVKEDSVFWVAWALDQVFVNEVQDVILIFLLEKFVKLIMFPR